MKGVAKIQFDRLRRSRREQAETEGGEHSNLTYKCIVVKYWKILCIIGFLIVGVLWRVLQ